MFRLVHRNGDEIGVHRFAVPDWKPGDTIPLGGGVLRVVEVEWGEEDNEVAATLIVELA